MNRRELIQGGVLAGLAMPALAQPGASGPRPKSQVEQWDCYEVALNGPATGNPFIEVTLSGLFHYGHRTVEANGFYDGAGVYRIRFMPDMTGEWQFETKSNVSALNGHRGAFHAAPASKNNHGPVEVRHEFHFQYADAAPYFPFGTTCYSMGFLGAPYEEETLESLKTAPFNKVRLCLLPKPLGHKLFALPFPRSASGENDLTRFNPAYFQHVERRIRDLGALGIEADVILLHPYDKWGYKSMPPEADDRYLQYAVARLAGYRNVWWSMANEYDLIKSKTMADWNRLLRLLQASDPSVHLRSIHYSRTLFDYASPLVTHASLQSYDFAAAEEWHKGWNKPIIYDEMQYEGNISRRWGNLSAEEMTRRFWLAIVSGCYGTHGETYITKNGAPVWSDGGQLLGTSPPRIGFLKKLVESSTTVGFNEYNGAYYLSAGTPNQLYLYYFDYHQPAEYEFPLPSGIPFRAEMIDPWEMTIKPLSRAVQGKTKLKLPGKPCMAVRFMRVSS